ncbi:U3 small nucleolar RNA-associated protein 6-like protein [Leptotrombidium deliense]|uniref:U3 small nucleolar RNA-associated protein 6-like protein n=1 Tax=Leptotrombidium deliense TaxID=299467 RepID=A0A443SLX0_9ACAR|nr:U3 small nucleolar RNA-associated protein 6-like protein [Leptotrombidium deliense]
MAEIVEFRVEQGVQFFDEVVKNGIFDDEEVKQIIKKRKQFEYKLQRRQKNKLMYLKYIAYEHSLFKLIRRRRERLRFFGSYQEIDYTVSKKIKWLYKKVIARYPNDVDLWFSYIKFCKDVNLSEEVGEVYSRMLQLHSSNDSVWIAAAKWHFEENNSPDVARELLLRALRHVPESKSLWTEYFRMELMYISLVEKRMSVLEGSDGKAKKQRVSSSTSETDDKVLEGKIAMAVVDNAVKNRPSDVELLLSFVKVLDDFDSHLRLRMKNHICNILTNNFKDREETYDALARLYFDKAWLKKNVESEHLSNVEKKKLRNDKMKEIFEEGISVIKTEKMWSFYIKFHLQLLSETNDCEILNHILSLMERAWNDNLLSFNLFNEWMLLLNEKEENSKVLVDLIQKATQKWSSNATVWYTCLSVLTGKDSSFRLELKKLFERAIKRLENIEESEEESEADSYTVTSKTVFDVWNLYLDWASTTLSSAELLRSIEKSYLSNSATGNNLRRNREIAAFLKTKLIEKCMQYSDKGISRARFFYEKYKDVHPVNQSFFEKMLQLENEESTVHRSRVRKVFDDFVEHFGSLDHQVWLNYIEFELKNQKADKVSNLYFSACKNLTAEECEKFMVAYSLLRIENVDSD